MTPFYQEGPTLGNQYEEDSVLRAHLRRQLPPGMLREVEPGLRRLGERAATDLLELAREAEAQPPRHIPYDPWGRRIDRIEVSRAWQELHRAAAEEGIVATAYERRHGPWSRVHQFVRLYLYHPSSAVYSCPLAMTDGAARTLEIYGDADLRARAFPRLTTRDPHRFWTAGQWMTERRGGSDVSGTEPVARPEGDGFRLYGTKWFTSATTSDMALTLARIPGAEVGSRGLSLFYLDLRDDRGYLRNIQIHRLKDKLGTRALPTAELSLEGTPAWLVGGEGHGVRKIATMLNITRLYNACCAAATMRRGIALARDYARKRRVFGRLLADQPLHLETLAALETEFQVAFHLVFRAAELLGKEETGEASPEELGTLRLLIPLTKLYTGKQAVAVLSEVLEAFGGAGYVEDTGLPQLLRDAQVLPIWEGTTNVLSLDVLRAMERHGALEPFLADLRRRLEGISEPPLANSIARVRQGAAEIEGYLAELLAREREAVEAAARHLAFALARTYAASLLLEQAAWSLRHEGDERPAAAARRWCGWDLGLGQAASGPDVGESRILALDEATVPARETEPA